MIKVFVISYYFPPLNGVAANRVFSWTKNFYKHDIYPVIVTRHWSGMEKSWNDMTLENTTSASFKKESDYSVFCLPALRHYLASESFSVSFAPMIRKPAYLMLELMGHLNVATDAYASFKKFCISHLQKEKYDLILVSSPPLNSIRLASELSAIYNIPFIADFRDLWSNEYLRTNFQLTGLNKIRDDIKMSHIRKWLKKASAIIAVSEPIAKVLRRVYSGHSEIVLNGYDDSLFLNINKHVSIKFSITLMGSYYPQQNMGLLCEGINLFLKNKSPQKVCVRMFGLRILPEVSRLIENALPLSFQEIHDRVGTQEAAVHAKNSDVLLHAGWKGYQGIYTTKIFDFLASGTNILLAPGDDDVLNELIISTNSGKIAETPMEIATYLQIYYNQWEKDGFIRYDGNKLINEYSRTAQNQKLIDLIKTTVLNKSLEKIS